MVACVSCEKHEYRSTRRKVFSDSKNLGGEKKFTESARPNGVVFFECLLRKSVKSADALRLPGISTAEKIFGGERSSPRIDHVAITWM